MDKIDPSDGFPSLNYQAIDALSERLSNAIDSGLFRIHARYIERSAIEIRDYLERLLADASTVFDRAIVYPFDYPTTPSTFPDYIWAGSHQEGEDE